MPLKIVRNDITRMKVDAIVNTANPKPIYGSGTDRAVYLAAGAEALLAEREKIGPMEPGQAAITPGFALPSKHIIHTVGPVWNGGEQGEEETLGRCYRNCLALAKELGAESVAFPMISCGVYGFPKDRALKVALTAFSQFLMEEDMTVYLVVFGRSAVQLSQKLTAEIDSYVDDHYVDEKLEEEYPVFECRVKDEDAPDGSSSIYYAQECLSSDEREEAAYRRRLSTYNQAPRRPIGKAEKAAKEAPIEEDSAPLPRAASCSSSRPRRSLDDLLWQKPETFQQSMFRIIGERGMKNTEVYRRANLQRQLFGKIKANVDYAPKKQTALALCVGLMLNLDETKDLLLRAGYALSPCSQVDMIVAYFIEQEVYNVITIDAALYEHGLPMLSNY